MVVASLLVHLPDHLRARNTSSRWGLADLREVGNERRHHRVYCGKLAIFAASRLLEIGAQSGFNFDSDQSREINIISERFLAVLHSISDQSVCLKQLNCVKVANLEWKAILLNARKVKLKQSRASV